MSRPSPLYWPSLALFTVCTYLASHALVIGDGSAAVIYMSATFLATIMLVAHS